MRTIVETACGNNHFIVVLLLVLFLVMFIARGHGNPIVVLEGAYIERLFDQEPLFVLQEREYICGCCRKDDEHGKGEVQEKECQFVADEKG